jgi:hypothetical protein
MADGSVIAGALPAQREAALWTELDRRLTDMWARDAVVLVVGFPPASARTLIPVLEAAGADFVAMAPRLGSIRRNPGLSRRITHVIVNLDIHRDLTQAVDDMLAFRRAVAKAVVLCVSGFVAADDLTLERRAICHATLRAPFGADRLREAFIAASANAVLCRPPAPAPAPAR